MRILNKSNKSIFLKAKYNNEFPIEIMESIRHLEMKRQFYLCNRYRERCQSWDNQIFYCKISTTTVIINQSLRSLTQYKIVLYLYLSGVTELE